MAELTAELIQRLHHNLDAAREQDTARLQAALQSSHIVGVHGEAEIGITSVVSHALRGRSDVVRIDLDEATSVGELARLFALATARLIVPRTALRLARLGPGLRPSSARAAIADLDRELGVDVAHLALSDQASPDDDDRLPIVLDRLAMLSERRDVLIWVDHLQAPSLTPRHPVDVGQLLWDLRSRQQRNPFRLLLSGHTVATAQATGPNAAFYGAYQWLALTRPSDDQWTAYMRALWAPSPAPLPSWREDLLALTGSHPSTTMLALAAALDHDRPASPQDLVRRLVRNDPGLTKRALQHARTLHRLGGGLVERISRGEGPYVGVPKAQQNTVGRALADLRRAGLLTNPAPSQWTVTNPLTAIALRGIVAQIQPALEEDHVEDPHLVS